MKINRYTVFLLLLAGCSLSPQLRREDAAGQLSFTAAGSLQRVYETMLDHARTCYERASSSNIYLVLGNSAFPGNNGTIRILRQRALAQEELFSIEMSRRDDGTTEVTEVTVSYAQQRFRMAAAAMEAWIKKGSSECNRDQVDVECICTRDGDDGKGRLFAGMTVAGKSS